MDLLTLFLTLSAPVLLAPAQVHVADFDAGGPSGLSRRAFVSLATDASWDTPCVVSDDSALGTNPYRHARTDWKQQFWDGVYRYLNPNDEQLVVADLGTGLGDEMLPGPLVMGGIHTAGAPAPLDGAFGPYATPFTFEAYFDDWSQYDVQERFVYPDDLTSNPVVPHDPPTDGQGNSVWRVPDDVKSAGIVVQVQTSAGLTAQATLGVYSDANGDVLRVFDADGNSVPGSVDVPLAGLVTGDPWSLHLLARANGVQITVRQWPGGGSTSVVVAQSGLPVHVTAVDAAALRLSGMTTPNVGGTVQVFDVDRIEVGAPNVPAFSGPAELTVDPVPPVATPVPYLVRDGTTLFLDGTGVPGGSPATAGPFQGTGVNIPQLMEWYAGTGGATREYGRHTLEQLVASSHHRTVRFYMFNINSRYVKASAPAGWKASDPNPWPSSQYALYDLWDAHRADYLEAFDALLSDAQDLGLYLVPSVIAGVRDPYTWAKGDQTKAQVDAAFVREVYSDAPCSAPGTAECNAVDKARALVVDVVNTVGARYRDHGTVLCWEVGNEWANGIDHSLVAWPSSPNWSVTWDTWDQCGVAVDWLATKLHQADDRHLVESGHGGRFALNADAVTGCMSPAAMRESFEATHPQSVDIACWHQYGSKLDSTDPVPCGDWPYVPFQSWGDYNAHIISLAHEQDFGGGDVGRPVVVGETSHSRFATYQEAVWQQMLDAYSVNGDQGQGPNVPLSMQWKWMETPDAGIYDLHTLEPQDITNPPMTGPDCTTPVLDTRSQLYEQYSRDATGRPRVTAMGFGDTHLTAGTSNDPLAVEAWIHDLQGDVSAVTAWFDDVHDVNFSGLLPLALNSSDGTLWSAQSTVSGYLQSDLLVSVVAVDAAGSFSRATPWISVGPGAPLGVAPGPGTLSTFAAPAGSAPRIRVAGGLGFEPIGGENERFVLTLQLADAGGQPIVGTDVPTILGRFNPDGLLLPSEGWNLEPGFFGFRDDGLGLDVVADDGWWVASHVLTPSEQIAFAAIPGELLVELAVIDQGAVSAIWPRLTVH